MNSEHSCGVCESKTRVEQGMSNWSSGTRRRGGMSLNKVKLTSWLKIPHASLYILVVSGGGIKQVGLSRTLFEFQRDKSLAIFHHLDWTQKES